MTETGISSISKALAIFELLASAQEGMELREIASALNLPKPSLRRILLILMADGYVHQDENSRRYELGLKFLQLGTAHLEKMDIRKKALPVLKELMLETDETVHLAILDGTEIIFVERVESSQAVRMISKLGMRIPAQLTASGKALLAFLPAVERARLLSRLNYEKRLPNSIAEARILEEHLQEVAQQGFAIDDEESDTGVRCLAAPVCDSRGRPVAAVSVSGPKARLPMDFLYRELSAKVMAAAKNVGRLLGGNRYETGFGNLKSLV